MGLGGSCWVMERPGRAWGALEGPGVACWVLVGPGGPWRALEVPGESYPWLTLLTAFAGGESSRRGARTWTRTDQDKPSLGNWPGATSARPAGPLPPDEA